MMIEKKLQEISTCHLIFELLHDGKGNIYPELEPVDTNLIVETLRERHGDWGSDAESWGAWFVGSLNVGTPDERGSIAATLRIRKIEKDASRRKGADEN